jgi:hypothetical protein
VFADVVGYFFSIERKKNEKSLVSAHDDVHLN